MQHTNARDHLRRVLARIDGRPYPAYRDLLGAYDFDAFQLEVEHVQPDPFAPASRLLVRLPLAGAGLGEFDLRDPVWRVGTEDWLLRRLAAALARAADAEGAARPAPAPGQGPVARPSAEDSLPAGCLRVLVPGQQVLERSALTVRGAAMEIRLLCDLPADQRRVQAGRAAAALDVALPGAVSAMLPQGPADAAELRQHVELLEDQAALRAELGRRGWVAFLADGAVLPRATGTSDLPLTGRQAVRLHAPDGLAATVDLPHRGTVRGLPIPEGVTLIVGGAYHGKSTLLRAIERGVYDHVAGDGRELCITRSDAAAVAAEDGRAVAGTAISAFVRQLPGGADTRAFRTEAASGSTSQAAALCEALEMDSLCLLMDEDRGAANFMSRDSRMRQLVPDAEDPVVPFSDRIRWLRVERGVSTVLVVGGSGAFLDKADTVIRMRDYQPEDVTAQARAIAREGATASAPDPDHRTQPRVLAADAFGQAPGDRLRVRARAGRGLTVGDASVDLRAQSQIVEEGQVEALADMLACAARYCDGRRTVPEIVRDVFADLDRLGFRALSSRAGQCRGDYARPRPLELAAAISRVPGVRLAGDPEREITRPTRTWRPLPGAVVVRRAGAEGDRPTGAREVRAEGVRGRGTQEIRRGADRPRVTTGRGKEETGRGDRRAGGLLDRPRAAGDARPAAAGGRGTGSARPTTAGVRGTGGTRPEATGVRGIGGMRPAAAGGRGAGGIRPAADGPRGTGGARPKADGGRGRPTRDQRPGAGSGPLRPGKDGRPGARPGAAASPRTGTRSAAGSGGNRGQRALRPVLGTMDSTVSRGKQTSKPTKKTQK